jgi:hypothetical protein
MRQRLTRFTLGAVFLTGLALASLGAKCIENTSVYVDDEGYTHIAGEMHNETDIQATRMILRGTLFDAAGNVIATKDAPTCPPDTQPNSQIIFDIRFDNPGVPPHARYEVRAASGITLEAPLPKPDVVIQSTDAIQFIGYPFIPEFPVEDTDVFFRYDIRNRSDQAFTGLQGCAAAYDNQGKVVRAEYGEIIELDASGNPVPATLDNQFLSTVFMRMSSVPESAVLVRGWIWFGAKDAPTSQYQFFSTPKITIQTDTFP